MNKKAEERLTKAIVVIITSIIASNSVIQFIANITSQPVAIATFIFLVAIGFIDYGILKVWK